MKISTVIPEAKDLTKLGFRRQPRPTLASIFGVQNLGTRRRDLPIKPDVDYHPEAERKPQATSYAGMWIDEFQNIGNIHNPLGSPMESGA